MITTNIQDISIILDSDASLFSPQAVDRGTQAMLSFVTIREHEKLLDLGCGYGIVGIWAAKKAPQCEITMCDINPKAIACVLKNLQINQISNTTHVIESNGFEQIKEKDYTLILSNPPYHTDFSVAKHFIEQGYRHLAMGGEMVMVTKRRDWYQNKLITIFGGVKVLQKDGYYIFIAQKREQKKKPVKKQAPSLSKKLQRKMNRLAKL